jgi:elongation factor 3
MLAKASTPSTVPPTQDEISSFLDTIFSAQTSQASLDSSYALTNLLINSVGFRGLHGYGIIKELKKAAADKKSGTKRESAMIVLGALLEKFPPSQPVTEVIFLQQDGVLPSALDALADKGAVVRESAQYAIDAFFNNLRVESLVFGLLPVLVTYLGKKSGKWQGAIGALGLIGRMADKAKMGTSSKEEERNKDFLREAMGKRLEGLIPIVESGMHDLKSEVFTFSCPLAKY